MKILHLVLYNDAPEYRPMYHHTRAWYKECESLGIETWYYRYNPDVMQPSFHKDTMMLELPGSETYIPGVLQKTIAAFCVGVAKGFQLFVRSNVSTVVNFQSLLQHYMQHKDNDMLYGGPHVMVSAENKELGQQMFVQGTCMLFAPKVINMLVKHAKQLCQTAEDDYAIGAFLRKRDILPTQIGHQYATYSPFQNINDVAAYRNHAFNSDRKDNIGNIRLEVNALFQRYMFLKSPQRVQQVLYFNLDVTMAVKALCQQMHEWNTTQNNYQLDKLFGDPSHNLAKNLMVYFTNDGVAPLTQRCNLRFFLQDSELFVQ